MTYRIELAPCINCGMCRLACPTDTIRYYSTGHRTHVVEEDGCIDCGICAQVCPVDCVYSFPEVQPPPAKLEAAKAVARARAASNRGSILAIDDRVKRFVGRAAPARDLTLTPQYVSGPDGGDS